MTSVKYCPQITYFRIGLGMCTMIIFSIVAIFGLAGESELEKQQSRVFPQLVWDAFFWFFLLLPIFIMGLTLWIAGVVSFDRTPKHPNTTSKESQK